MRLKFDPALLPAAPDFSFELERWAVGCRRVAGVDEAGRGAFAGPVAAGALIFAPDAGLAFRLQGVRDSKQMTPAARQEWAARLKELALAWGVGFASPQEIDSQGILPATRLAMQRALDGLGAAPDALLVDYITLPKMQAPCLPLVKGDNRSLSIAAASILAKTARDALMRELDGQYPGYGLAENKGYGTPFHRQALLRLGPSPIHRMSFRWKTLPASGEL